MMRSLEQIYNQIFSCIYYLIGFISISLNIALLYMILTRATNRIKEYRILLANTALIDVVKSLMLTLVQPRWDVQFFFFFDSMNFQKFAEKTMKKQKFSASFSLLSCYVYCKLYCILEKYCNIKINCVALNFFFFVN